VRVEVRETWCRCTRTPRGVGGVDREHGGNRANGGNGATGPNGVPLGRGPRVDSVPRQHGLDGDDIRFRHCCDAESITFVDDEGWVLESSHGVCRREVRGEHGARFEFWSGVEMARNFSKKARSSPRSRQVGGQIRRSGERRRNVTRPCLDFNPSVVTGDATAVS